MTKTKLSELEPGDACLFGNWEAIVDRVELRTMYLKVTVPLSDGTVEVRLKQAWRDSGRLVGEWSKFRVHLATDSAAEEASDGRRRRALIFACKDYAHWELLPTADLERVAKLLKVQP